MLTQTSLGHEDLVHDIAYDYYGKRLASCSSDQRIKIWEIHADSASSAWVLNDTWKAHDASVLKVAWAHPEFGQLFASCSLDRTVRIWEEQEGEMKNGGRRWVERARLSDSKGPIQSIEFAPHHSGLKLASLGADGIVRIYEAMDVVNLTSWTLLEEFELTGSSLSSSSALMVNAGAANAVNNVLKEPEGHFCFSWCPSRFQPAMMAVGCGRENTAKIFRVDEHNKWQAYEILPGHTDLVCDIAWAPNLGRSYQLIATASKDHHVRIYKLIEENKVRGGAAIGGSPAGKKKFGVELVADFVDHHAEVWKVEWNVTGTVLSSSGDDGKVRLWKASFLNEWGCIGIVSAQTAPSPQ